MEKEIKLLVRAPFQLGKIVESPYIKRDHEGEEDEADFGPQVSFVRID